MQPGSARCPHARPRSGLVTSLSGAVLHDVRRVLERRWPLVRLVVSACRVQGEGSVETIVAALARLARYDAACRAAGRSADAPAVVIVARGGGSLEDLWSFNDERVVRAVVGHPVPVVSGVGHETDVTLVDFAADVRAPTPSAAAELVVPDRGEALVALRARRVRLDAALGAEMAALGRRVAAERRALDGLHPQARLAASRERAGFLLDRATAAVAKRLAADRRGTERAGASLRAARGGPGGGVAGPRRGDPWLAGRPGARGDARPRLRDRAPGGRRDDRSRAGRGSARHRPPVAGRAGRDRGHRAGRRSLMDVILLLVGAAAVAAAGVALGLALAPRLARWDEARAEDHGAAPRIRGRLRWRRGERLRVGRSGGRRGTGPGRRRRAS